MELQPLFRSREEAGQQLGRRLATEIDDPNPMILALPRGGVPVGFQVAQILHADLDVFLVRKLGVPGHEELAMGAIASGGVHVLNQALIEQMGISRSVIERAIAREEFEIERRERLYRDGRPAPFVRERTVILVDDGLATGASMTAAVRALKASHPKRTVVAVPVASAEACEEIGELVDQVICLFTPEPFYAVGIWYADFSQTSDEEVRDLLERAMREHVR